MENITIELSLKIARSEFNTVLHVRETVNLPDIAPEDAGFAQRVMETGGMMAVSLLERAEKLAAMHSDHLKEV